MVAAKSTHALNSSDTQIGFEFRVMGGQGVIRMAGVPDAQAQQMANAAIAEVRRIEAKYSRYQSDSVVSRINASAGSGQAVAVDDETAHLLDFAATLHTLSDGLFDITSGVLRKAWHFQSGKLPLQTELDAYLPLVGWQHVNWTEAKADQMQREVSLTLPGMEIDFGGFGKEYAADRAAAVLIEAGARHAVVNLGGDIRVIGPQANGEPWRLGIQHPRQTGALVHAVSLSEGALATSGDYERYMEVNGQRFCHILQPHNGWPVSHWQSVSVTAPLCVAAGAMSTIAMLKQANAIDFLLEQGSTFLAINGQSERHTSSTML